jgi:hypothetical protein
MFCIRCGNPTAEGAPTCPRCGAPVGPGAISPVPLPSSDSGADSPLTTLPHLVMLWDKLSLLTNFQFVDSAGTPLGGTVGEIAFPLKYTLFDANQRLVLVLDAARVRGLLFQYLIHDATGAVLASLQVKSSFLSRKYGITVNGIESMLLTTDAMGYHYQIEAAGSGTVLATGVRTMALRTSRTEIQISPTTDLDHRIVLGSMILACYLSTRR